MESLEDDPGSEGPPNTLEERRRPGRMGAISPELIPLLRDAATTPVPREETQEDRIGGEPDRDDLRAARGLVVAVVLSAPLWGFIGLMIWLAVR